MRAPLSLALALALTVALTARADDENPDGGNHYELGLDIWLSMVAGHVDTSAGESSMYVSFSELKDHLNGALALYGRGDWGPWFMQLQGLYASMGGDSIDRTIRLGPHGNIEIPASVKPTLYEWVAQGSLGRRLFETRSLFSSRESDKRRFRVDAYLGARYWSVNPKVQVQVGGLSSRLGDRESWVDPVIGLRFGADLSSTVEMQVGGDVGGFNLGNYCSDFTWAQSTQLAWHMTDSWVTHIGYRFVDFHRDRGEVDQRIQTRGPFIDLGYSF